MRKSVSSLQFPHGFAIAIDGPVSSGKGTVAMELVHVLKAVNFNTGSMYRAIAYKCITKNVNCADEHEVEKILLNTRIKLLEKDKGDYAKVILDGQEITDKLFDPEVSHGSSLVAQYAKVRKYLSHKQRELALQAKKDKRIVVMEGRDIGTKVLPDADLKIYLIADPKVRAKRRLEQYKDRNINKTFNEVLKETIKRDMQDMTRVVDPLVSDPKGYGYNILDNSDLTINETVDIIVGLIKKK